jgi:hypothetical protein
LLLRKEGSVRWLLGLLAIYGIVTLILIALGFAVGLLLHWLLPSIDLGIGVLIGVVASGFSVQILARVSSLPLPDFGQDLEADLPPSIVYVDPPPERRKARHRPR